MAVNSMSEEMKARWKITADITAIPESFYQIQARTITDPHRKNPFKFGVFYNAARFSRPGIEAECRMCYELEEVKIKPQRELSRGEVSEFAVITNRYPSAFGFSMALPLTYGNRITHREMYNSTNLGRFVEDVQDLLPFAERHGFGLYHQTSGAGATIPQHEHWHLTNWGAMYEFAGEVYGFDATQPEKISGRSDVVVMEGFPFAHLIFTDKDPEKIAKFIRKLDYDLRDNYPSAHIPYAVPHTFSSGNLGILIAPMKCDVGRKMGSESPTGHWCVNNKEIFERATYSDCLARLDETMFRREDLDLTHYL